MTDKLLQRAVGDGGVGLRHSPMESLSDRELEVFRLIGRGVEGLAFHRFYFELGGVRGRHQTTLCSPHVRVLGDVAVVAYARLIQRVGPDGQAVTQATTETRVWHRTDGRWRHVHFHRTAVG